MKIIMNIRSTTFALFATVLIVAGGGLGVMPTVAQAADEYGSYTDGWFDAGSYNDSWYDAGSYNDQWYSADSYNDQWYSADSYNDQWYSADSYNDQWNSADSYNDQWYSADSYNDQWYSADSYSDQWYSADSTQDTWYSADSTQDNIYSADSTPVYSYSQPYSSSYTTSSMAQPISWGTYSIGKGSSIGGGSYNISYPVSIGKSSTSYYPVQYYPQNPVPSCSLIASPSQIHQGGTSTLIWSSANATSASISNGVGSVSLSGSRSVTVNGPITYVMTVSGPGGTSNCQTTITVTQVPPVQNLWCTIQASPSSITSGNVSTLTWNSSGATSANLSNYGGVSVNGTQNVYPTTSTTYTLTVYGSNGQSTNCQTTVYVNSTPINNLYCTIQQAQSYNAYNNQPVYLSWTSNGATSAYLTNVGNVSVNGSTTVYPTGSMTYTLTVYGANGQSANCQTTVYNNTIPTGNLYCTLTANPSTVQNGNGSVLSWTSYGATSAFLSDGLGYQQVNGSLTVRPESNRTYTLTVYGNNGQSATCATNVNVSGQYVSLTSIPYTGFDLGPVGNALYFLGLMVLAGGAAYFALSYNGGIMGLVASGLSNRKSYAPVVLHEAVVAKKAPVAETVTEEPVLTQKTVFAPTSLPTNTTTKDSVVASVDASGTPRLVIARN